MVPAILSVVEQLVGIEEVGLRPGKRLAEHTIPELAVEILGIFVYRVRYTVVGKQKQRLVKLGA